jgi:hypothetical protein
MTKRPDNREGSVMRSSVMPSLKYSRSGSLPTKIVRRKKHGLAAPFDQWLRGQNPVLTAVHNGFLSVKNAASLLPQ